MKNVKKPMNLPGNFALIALIFAIATFSVNRAFSQNWGSRTGTGADAYVINSDNSNNWTYLRLQTSNNRAWNILNQGDLKWNYAGNGNHGDVGSTKMRLSSGGNLKIYTNQNNSPQIRLNDGFSISTVFNNKDVVFRNMNQLRFSDVNNWDWNTWAGIAYKNAQKKLIIGGPKSGYFNNNSNAPGIDVIFDGVDGVGIGTNDPGSYKLAVEGKIGARGVDVKVGSWADFVFEEDYALKPLAEVATFIKENKHLPDVPSEAEVLEKGIDIAKMDAILLQKIEELTLYIIELKKEKDAEISELKKALDNR